MSNYTPGPWKATPDNSMLGEINDDYCIGSGDKIDNVAVCSKQDAILIEQAPNLYELLLSLEPFFDKCFAPDVALNAKEVLAKVKGHI